MRIFSKTKATLALLAAVLVAGFAFAKTVEVTNVVWDEGKTFDVVERGTIELTGITAAVGDKLVITYEKTGAAAQEEARAAVPMRDVKKDADIWVFVGATTGDPAEKFEAIEGAGTKEYTFTQAIEATTIVELSARNLTITKVEVVSAIEVAEQLTNSDFSQGAALDNHLCGYGKDMAAQNTTYYGLQDVDGWTKVVVNGDNSSASFPNSGMGGGVFAYGSDWQMKGNNVKAPAAGPDGAAGQALGFFAVWGLGGYYYQDIALPAGKYTFMTYIYNQSGTQANTTQTGFFVDGVAKATVAINTAVGQWTLQTADFELTEETIGQVRVGYVSTGSGSAANPMLFFDYVKVLSELDAAVEAYNAALQAANAASDAVVTGEEQQTFNAAIAANSNIDMTSLDAVKAATEALNPESAQIHIH